VVAQILADSGLTQIAGVQFPTNALDTKTNGVDLAANWRLPTSFGNFDFNAQLNYTKNEITRISPLPKILEGTGTIYTSALDPVTINSIVRNRPDRRSSLTANYSLGRAHALGRISDFGSFRDGSADGIETFGAKQLFDAELGYRFEQITLSFGARNLFNVYPDQTKIEANTNNGTFIWPGASPFGYNGRYIYVRSEILHTR
jgi:iron complex outermembrane receptor protein